MNINSAGRLLKEHTHSSPRAAVFVGMFIAQGLWGWYLNYHLFKLNVNPLQSNTGSKVDMAQPTFICSIPAKVIGNHCIYMGTKLGALNRVGKGSSYFNITFCSIYPF